MALWYYDDDRILGATGFVPRQPAFRLFNIFKTCLKFSVRRVPGTFILTWHFHILCSWLTKFSFEICKHLTGIDHIFRWGFILPRYSDEKGIDLIFFTGQGIKLFTSLDISHFIFLYSHSDEFMNIRQALYCILQDQFSFENVSFPAATEDQFLCDSWFGMFRCLC